MKNIVLATINARYTHASLALRYLHANLGGLRDEAVIEEFVINEDMQRVAESILAHAPRIVGIGVYIWNAEDAKELIETIKKVSPGTTVVIGGPEASYLPHRVDFSAADFVISGEGEEAFAALCRMVLAGDAPKERFIKAAPVNLKNIALPYKYYSDEDLAHRYLYVEASRGCPFECEFCLSSIDEKVRYFDADALMDEINAIWERGGRRFKFVDRTFNLNITLATKLLDFFLAKELPYKVHFEVIPEAFPSALKEKLALFAPDTLQLEVGIQTLNPQIAQNINRKMDFEKIKENIAFLEQHTNAHLHVDLIVGLPGEDLTSFGQGLNTLAALTKSEIQIGILKKLSGTTMSRHDEKYGMIYSDKPPYDILQSGSVSFVDIQRMKRFARFWDITYNSEKFVKTLELMWGDDVFGGFLAFSDWVYSTAQMTHQISFKRMCELIFVYLTTVLGHDELESAKIIAEDTKSYMGNGLPTIIADKLKTK
ncbi:MAG: DUF4080 domain-containing protein [Campylobacterales bacterium]